jgi:four helix bundle protein
MTIQRFEDLEAWKEARVLVAEVYKLVQRAEDFKRDYRFRDQITAAAVSTMSNIAEGFARRSDREFVQFLFITKGSCAEVQSLLYAALDQRYVAENDFQQCYARAEKVAKLTSGLITYLLRGKAPRSIESTRSTRSSQSVESIESIESLESVGSKKSKS